MSNPPNIYVAIIDDDDGVCRSLGRLLRVSGFQPITYLSAEAFFGDMNRPKFDCLIMDIQLGDTSGIELKMRLNAAGCATPVIFVTAHDNPGARAQALATGCAGYFRKTDAGAEIIDSIRRAVARPGYAPENLMGKGTS